MRVPRFLPGGNVNMLEKTLSGESVAASLHAKRSMRKRAPGKAAAAEPAPLFNYSEEEWLEIEEAVQAKGMLPKKARPPPSTALDLGNVSWPI
jgi:hypothetical protein